jgi:hypothetical protein
MSVAMQTIRRVTVYADSTLQGRLIETFMGLGSTGYTVLDCRGKGEHEIVEDPFGGFSRVRIELLVQPAVAERIIEHVTSKTYQGHALAACVETVEVAATEHF